MQPDEIAEASSEGGITIAFAAALTPTPDTLMNFVKKSLSETLGNATARGTPLFPSFTI
jgi:hypothetical protein